MLENVTQRICLAVFFSHLLCAARSDRRFCTGSITRTACPRCSTCRSSPISMFRCALVIYSSSLSRMIKPLQFIPMTRSCFLPVLNLASSSAFRFVASRGLCSYSCFRQSHDISHFRKFSLSFFSAVRRVAHPVASRLWRDVDHEAVRGRARAGAGALCVGLLDGARRHTAPAPVPERTAGMC